MECRNCGGRWKQDSSVRSYIIDCPFCKAQLINPNKSKKTKTYRNTKDVLLYIKINFGIETFSNVTKCINIFSDLAPDLIKEKHLLKVAFEQKIQNIFLENYKKDEDQKKFAIKKALKILMENASLAEHASVMIVESFIKVFDFDIPINYLYGCSSELYSYNLKFNFLRDSKEEYYKNAKVEFLEGNYSEAVLYYNISATKGNSLAKATLGICYYNGIGCTRDYKEAIMLFRESYKNKCDLGKAWLAYAYRDGNIVSKNNQLSKDMQKQVFDSLYKMARLSNDDAECFMGNCYYNGECVEKNYEKAFEWFLKSARQGNCEAQKNLGLCFKDGNGVKKDKEKAFEWFLKSSKQGYMLAQLELVNCYYNAIGIEKNEIKAFELCLKLANQGDKKAQFKLALFYLQGIGVAKNTKKYFEWLEKSANQGDNISEYHLGLTYYSGVGVEVDYKKAFEWILKSANQNCEKAKELLPIYYKEMTT